MDLCHFYNYVPKILAYTQYDKIKCIIVGFDCVFRHPRHNVSGSHPLKLFPFIILFVIFL